MEIIRFRLQLRFHVHSDRKLGAMNCLLRFECQKIISINKSTGNPRGIVQQTFMHHAVHNVQILKC